LNIFFIWIEFLLSDDKNLEFIYIIYIMSWFLSSNPKPGARVASVINNVNETNKKQNTTFDKNIEKIIEQCDTGKVATLDTCNLGDNYIKTFALTQTILEIYDADHDLNRSKYDKNPLVEYCKSFVGKYPKS
jgi:hypothetical protein